MYASNMVDVAAVNFNEFDAHDILDSLKSRFVSWGDVEYKDSTNLGGKMKRLDLTNMRFGHLVVLKRQEDKLWGQQVRPMWLCRCDCGKVVTVGAGHLRSGHTQSCGHWMKLQTSKAHWKHGHLASRHRSKEYVSWQNMKHRCYDTQDVMFASYGGRGISVCQRWRDSFVDFISDMGLCPKGKTLERLNTNGNYEPGNCIWANQEQQRNNKRNNRIITHNGLTMTLARWARHLNISRGMLTSALIRGTSMEEIERRARKRNGLE